VLNFFFTEVITTLFIGKYVIVKAITTLCMYSTGWCFSLDEGYGDREKLRRLSFAVDKNH